MRRATPGPVHVLLVWILLELVAAAQVPADRGSLLVSWGRVLARPVVVTANFLIEAAGDLVRGLGDVRALAQEHQRMRLELQRCRARQAALASEVNVLRSALPLLPSMQHLHAESRIVLCRYHDLSRGLLEVEGGMADGLRHDQPVVSARGVVGRLWRVGAHRSWVETITGPGAAVAVTTSEKGIRGLALGDGRGGLSVQYVPRSDQLLVGALLVTSGADGLYPAGLQVAEVLSVREAAGPFLEVKAIPTAELARLETALVLTSWTPSDSTP